MVNQVTTHLKRYNPDVCRVKDRKTLEVSHEDEHRWLQADKVLNFYLDSAAGWTLITFIQTYL